MDSKKEANSRRSADRRLSARSNRKMQENGNKNKLSETYFLNKDSGEDELESGDFITLKANKKTRTTSISEPLAVIQTSQKTIYTSGRPPWYNEQGEFKDAFVIGLTGGSASGKTTVAEKIIEALDLPWVVLFSMDSFYKELTPEQQEQAARNEYNFDHVDAFDFDLCVATLKKLKQGKKVDVPIYDFTTHSRKKQTKALYGANVIVFEGIMAFCKPELRDLLDMKIFVDTDSDVRLARRLKRDICQRGRDLQGVLAQYNKFVKPAFEKFIEPTRQYADIQVPRGGSNEVAVNLIAQHVSIQLENRHVNFRSLMDKQSHLDQPLPSSLYLLDQTVQVQCIHTILRDQQTQRDDFIFYSKRLMRLVFEFALSLLPHENTTVQTPQNTDYNGLKYKGSGLCGVSILRAGETMESALFSVTKDIRLGKLLIQTNKSTADPELHYIRVPPKIRDDHVILMDATVATGAAAIMAIRVLLDHDVQEENILLVALLMAESGVQNVAYAFPNVKIVTSAVDKNLDEHLHIVPGLGSFGDRYFGTE